MMFNKIDLYGTIEKGDVKKTKTILNQGFQMDAKTGEWSLFLAIKNNNLSTAALLQQKGAKIRNTGILKAANMFVQNTDSKNEKATFRTTLKALFPHMTDNKVLGGF